MCIIGGISVGKEGESVEDVWVGVVCRSVLHM